MVKKLISSIVLGVIGASVLVSEAALLVSKSWEWISVLALVTPTVFSVSLLVASYYLYTSGLDGDRSTKVALSSALGVVVLVLTVLFHMTYQIIKGGRIPDSYFNYLSHVSMGALAGFLVGWYHQREAARIQSLREKRKELRKKNK
ncbi:MAG: hypothetical protein SV253_06600 [Halobacteria archaeon]|nr:hypothetical protein [Halobacteria archaeon]